jgi:predicted nucleic acid-binding protein
MKEVFADAVYWIALFHPTENLHEKAKTASAELGNAKIATSEMVLCEVLNHLAARGEKIRARSAEMVEQLRKHPNVVVIPQTSDLFQRALDRYKNRADKEWSLTDCASFIVMEQRKMDSSLTYDKHFEQAGFVALLKSK